VRPDLNGALAAELLAKFTAPGSRVAVVAGVLQTEDQQQKTRGFSDAFPQWCPAGEVAGIVQGYDDEVETFHASLDLLRRHPSLDGLYVSNAMCIPVCRALRECELMGRVKLVTTDLFKEMGPFLENGAISASIYQRPYLQGQTAVRLIADHLTGGEAIPSTYYLNPGIVFRSNLHLFREMRQAAAAVSSAQGTTSLRDDDARVR
jgi:LacI family transcriptional regulator